MHSHSPRPLVMQKKSTKNLKKNLKKLWNALDDYRWGAAAAIADARGADRLASADEIVEQCDDDASSGAADRVT